MAFDAFEAKESKAMANTYDAKGVPHLVVVDGATGDIITKDGTEVVIYQVNIAILHPTLSRINI
jgi:hypothetical protein